MSHDIRFGRLRKPGCFQQIVEGDALPCRIELRPFRDAMNIGLDRSLRQRFELGPTPHPEQGTAKLKSQIPVCHFGLWGWARRKNREFGCHVLPGRHTIRLSFLVSLRPKPARDVSLVHRIMPFLVVRAPRKKNLDAVIRSSAGRSATLATKAFACRWALRRMHQDLKSEGNCRRARY